MRNHNNVLLIDDDPISNFISYAIIETLGIAREITIENNGIEGLNYIVNNYMKGFRPPDLILLDINMPIFDGFEFLEEFEKLPEEITKDTVVIVLSNLFRKADIDVLNKKEMLYMSKPLTCASLMEMLERKGRGVEILNGRVSDFNGN